MAVAIGGRSLGRDSSPTTRRPSRASSVTGSRCAGRTVVARISSMPGCVPRPLDPSTTPQPSLPTRLVPVPSRVLVADPPRDEVRQSGGDLLVAAGTSIDLDRAAAGHDTHRPLAVRSALGLRHDVVT